MNKNLQDLNGTKWYRLVKVIYGLALIVVIAVIIYIGYEGNGFSLWGYFFQFSFFWIIIALIVSQIIKRIFYYVYFGKFILEIQKNKLINYWDLVIVGVLLIALLVNWIAWRPHHIRIQCWTSTMSTIYYTDFDKEYPKAEQKYLDCLNKHNIRDYE